MMFIFKVILSVIALLLAQGGAYAQKPEAYVKIINMSTKIEKKYPIGNASFSFQLLETKGWSKCTVLPINLFNYSNKQRMRVDVFCFSNQGVAVMFSCTTEKNNIDVTINRLLGTNTVIVSDGESRSDSATEIFLSCAYI
jgi:hypothetical protein